MDLNNITLEDWLKAPPPENLKRGGDSFEFSDKYNVLKGYLKETLHKEVTKAAIYRDFLIGKNPNTIIYLNDHGPDHIKRVILMASELLSNTCKLNAREVFFLINAIQIHDIGNFYGRTDHESKVIEAIKTGLTPILFDSTEVNYIKNIAQVHGGTIKYKNGEENKNTISSIKPNVTSDDYPIRLQFLASILRFADEIADHKKRADIITLEQGVMAKGSEIFHAYSACLDSVKINHEINTVELHFKIPKKYLIRTFGKIQKDGTITDEYILDEIYKRAIKMHSERIYCSKFWKREIEIDKLWIQIEFYNDPKEEGMLEEGDLFVHNEITFSLNDDEYPNILMDIFSLCPDLKYGNGDKMTGKNLFNKLTKNA